MKRSAFPIALGFALAACGTASGGVQGPSITPSNTTISGTGNSANTSNATASRTLGAYADNGPSTVRVQRTPNEVLAVLRDAFTDAGLPAPAIDPVQNMVATPRFELSREFAGQRMSNYFSCGETPTGRPVSEAYRLSLQAQSSVRAHQAGSQLETVVTATAYNPGTGATSTCSTTGVMEKRVNDAVLRRLGAAPAH